MTIDSRAIYINGINQDIPQSQFMKLWKTVSSFTELLFWKIQLLLEEMQN